MSIISSIWQMFNRRKNFEATWPPGALIIAHARATATWFAEKTRLRTQPSRRRSRWRGMCRTVWCVPVVFRFRALVFGARVRGIFRRGCKNKPARVRSRRRRDVPVAPVARTAFGWVLPTETTSIQGGAVARTPPKRPRRAPTDPPFERPCLSVRQKIRKIRRALETAWLDRVSRRFQDFRASFHIKLTASIPFLFLFFSHATHTSHPKQSCKRSRLKSCFSPGRACCAECLRRRRERQSEKRDVAKRQKRALEMGTCWVSQIQAQRLRTLSDCLSALLVTFTSTGDCYIRHK